MKLYDTPQAPNARRVRMFLAEKRLDIPREEINLIEGGARTEAFTALNPMRAVPVLVLDDGSVLSESIAICRYAATGDLGQSYFFRQPVSQHLHRRHAGVPHRW